MQAQRPARRLQLEPQPAVLHARSRPAEPARPSWLGEPRPRSSSSAPVGLVGRRAGGRERLIAPGRPRFRRVPRAAGQQCRARSPPLHGSQDRLRGDPGARRLKHWGWGYEDEQPLGQELRTAAAFLAGASRLRLRRAVRAGPAVGACTSGAAADARRRTWRRSAAHDDYERALHAYGRSYSDVVRAFRGRFDHPPDVVAHPRDEAEMQCRAGVGARRRRRRDPVRRRDQRRRRRRARGAGTASPGW